MKPPAATSIFSQPVAEFARIQVVESACRNSGEFRYKRVVASLFSVAVLFSLFAINGDGRRGHDSSLEQTGDYQITIFTAPTPLRPVPVDVSVLIQNAATQQPVSDAEITIRTHRGQHGAVIRHPRQSRRRQTSCSGAATFDLDEPGWWEIEASVDGPLGETQARFDVEAAEPLPPYLAMWAWIGWPVVSDRAGLVFISL